MAVSGGVKFFDKNKINEVTSITATSGQASVSNILNREKYSYWRSVGSDDTKIESIFIYLPEEISINRVFIIGHNFKNYILYCFIEQLGSYQRFGATPMSGVETLNGAKQDTSTETDYASSLSYYEFSEVSTSRFWIRAYTTQIPDQEKFLGQFIVSKELGTLEGYPDVSEIQVNKNLEISKMLSGRIRVNRAIETQSYKLNFKNYNPDMSADLELMKSLADRSEPFQTWLCGGRTGETYFKYQIPGFALEDLRLTQITNVNRYNYKDNYYRGAINLQATLEESV